jgi:hopanoid C-3 methylase
MKDALIVSTFEGGYQPMTAVTAATALRVAGLDIDLLDIYVDGPQQERFREAETIGISVPLFDSLHAGIEISRQIRHENPATRIIFFGQYATINASRLCGSHGDFAITGEWEAPLVELVRQLKDGRKREKIAGVMDAENVAQCASARPYISRKHFQVPDRTLAPPLLKYPQPQVEKLTGARQVVGAAETTRGCHHKCTYCSVFAAYDGKVLLVPEAVVLADVRAQVQQGMTHLTFTDADFFNTKRHGVEIIRHLHGEFPNLTYDFTARIDHILQHKDTLGELGQLGVRFITSALEFPNQRVLDEVQKEMTVEMLDDAVNLMRAVGIVLNPTFIMFNPWIGLQDLARFNDFVERTHMETVIDPIQYETRLHLYKGSPLLGNSSIRALPLKEHEFHFEWQHPDPNVDELYQENLTPVEEGVFKRCCLKC